jgi:hypothetical protein
MTRDDLADLLDRMRDRLRELNAWLEHAAALGNDLDKTADLGWMRAQIAARVDVVEDLLFGWDDYE